jgi:hypothetical protein
MPLRHCKWGQSDIFFVLRLQVTPRPAIKHGMLKGCRTQRIHLNIQFCCVGVQNKCDLINMSYGEPTSMPDYGRFIQLADEARAKPDRSCRYFS